MNLLPCVEVEPEQAAVASIIWLHGLGADGYDFEPIAPQLRLPAPVRFVLPHAPLRPVTINQGQIMPAWFDILTLERLDKVDETGIRHSVADLIQLVEREVERGIAAERILLAGFSQGGVVALHAAAQYPQTLAGVIALSTYLPLVDLLQTELTPANQGLPIFMAHGRMDPVLPFVLGQQSYTALQTLQFPVEWHDYGMEHTVCAEEIDDLREWILALPSLQPLFAAA